ncbi:MAG: ankyrin repeat domain-containing protein [Hyphomicrobiales bacterium]|nr:ankyrin repeat domain-containing protein [Hyphomicrobiales bacterium]
MTLLISFSTGLAAKRLEYAVLERPIVIVLTIVTRGTFCSNAGSNELLNAALAGDLDKATTLLVDGAEVDPAGPATPLYFAAQNGHQDVAALLIEHGADVNAQSKNGTPLHIAARRNQPEIVSLLLKNGADSEAVGGDYRHTPLHMAARTGALEAGRILVDHGADVNARSRWFEPPIHFAVLKGRSEFAEFLREAGATPFPVDDISKDLASADLKAGEIRATECSNCHLESVTFRRKHIRHF